MYVPAGPAVWQLRIWRPPNRALWGEGMETCGGRREEKVEGVRTEDEGGGRTEEENEVATRTFNLVASLQSPVAIVCRAVNGGHDHHLYKTRENESQRGRDHTEKKAPIGLPPHVQPLALTPSSDSRFNRYKLSPSHRSMRKRKTKSRLSWPLTKELIPTDGSLKK